MNNKKATAFGLVAALLLGPAALGSTRTISDPDDVPRRRIDIKSASAGHVNGKLKHTIVSYRRFRTSRGPCVNFETKPKAGRDFQVCGFGNMTNLHQEETKGTADIRRPNMRTIVYVFRPRAIGRPSVYKWFVREEGREIQDTPECPNCDRAPNRGMVRHNI